MFDVTTFVTACRDAIKDVDPRSRIRSLLGEALTRSEDLREVLNVPCYEGRLEDRILFHSPHLTIMKTIFASRTVSPPHDHRAWAAIAVYEGQEVNVLYRRSLSGLTEFQTVRSKAPSLLVLDESTIHAVRNPLGSPSRALHVYLGDLLDLVARPRSMWEPHTVRGVPYDFALFAKWESQSLER